LNPWIEPTRQEVEMFGRRKASAVAEPEEVPEATSEAPPSGCYTVTDPGEGEGFGIAAWSCGPDFGALVRVIDREPGGFRRKMDAARHAALVPVLDRVREAREAFLSDPGGPYQEWGRASEELGALRAELGPGEEALATLKAKTWLARGEPDNDAHPARLAAAVSAQVDALKTKVAQAEARVSALFREASEGVRRATHEVRRAALDEAVAARDTAMARLAAVMGPHALAVWAADDARTILRGEDVLGDLDKLPGVT
jgi:hypothetical protein